MPVNNFATLFTDDVLKKGVYPIKYRVFYSNPAYSANIVTLADPFVITITDPCDDPVIVTASSLIAQEYTITDSPAIYQIPVFIADPLWCDISYSYAITDISGDASLSFNPDPSTPEFTFAYDSDLNLCGPASTDY